jgi:hypothetical protein
VLKSILVPTTLKMSQMKLLWEQHKGPLEPAMTNLTSPHWNCVRRGSLPKALCSKCWVLLKGG